MTSLGGKSEEAQRAEMKLHDQAEEDADSFVEDLEDFLDGEERDDR